MVLPNVRLSLVHSTRVMDSMVSESHLGHFEAICSSYIAIPNWLKDVDATEKNDSGAKAGAFL